MVRADGSVMTRAGLPVLRPPGRPPRATSARRCRRPSGRPRPTGGRLRKAAQEITPAEPQGPGVLPRVPGGRVRSPTTRSSDTWRPGCGRSTTRPTGGRSRVGRGRGPTRRAPVPGSVGSWPRSRGSPSSTRCAPRLNSPGHLPARPSTRRQGRPNGGEVRRGRGRYANNSYWVYGRPSGGAGGAAPGPVPRISSRSAAVATPERLRAAYRHLRR